MKKIKLLIVALATIVVSCKKEAANTTTVIITGQITNPTAENVQIFSSKRAVVSTMKLDENKKFRDTITLDEDFYTLSHGSETTKLYLKPGFNLEVTLDTKQFDETVTYKGTGETENNYLAKNYLFDEVVTKKPQEIAKMSEEVFLKKLDSTTKIKMKNFESLAGISPKFKKINSKFLEFEKLKSILNFKMFKKYLSGDKDFKVSENFPNPYDDKNMKKYLTDKELLEVPNYLPFVSGYYKGKASEAYVSIKEKPDYLLHTLNTYEKVIESKEIKESLVYNELKYGLNKTKELDKVFEVSKKMLTGEKLTKVTELYNGLKRIQKGKVSPNFKLKDIEGKEYALDGFKGNIVYIDIWATWCKPCVGEIPHLEKLQQAFKGKKIKFVSICQGDARESWESFLQKEKLGGIQLFAPSSKIPFIQDYMVTSIPRFILLDKEGKIIESNATRPSMPVTKTTLEELLK